MSDLDSLLNGEATVETIEVVTEVETPVVESISDATEPVGAEPSKEEKPEETTAEATGLKAELPSAEELKQQLEAQSKELNAYKVKARDEKSKRQELEKRELPDVLEDQKGYQEGVLQENQNYTAHALANQSEFHARRELGDEKVNEAFLQYEKLAESNPEVEAEVAASPSPWYTMIDIVERAQKLEKLSDPNYEAKVTAEIEAKVRAEFEAKEATRKQETAAITPNLAKKGSESVSDNNWTGPTPLNSLLA